MDAIIITTTQNVDLEYDPAGVGYRILATLLDGVFIVVYALLMLLMFTQFGFNYFYSSNQYLATTLIIICGLPVLMYHFLSETLMNGQSFGKKIIGIKVVKLDGTQPGISSYVLRSILRIIDLQLFSGVIGLITVVVSDNSQRLGDMAAGTTVIKLGPKTTLRDTILYRQVDNYKIVFEQVALLSDKDVAIVKEILEHSITNNKKENLTLLSQKVKAKMGVSSDLNDEIFLKTILLDYSHYQFEK
ncbi:MAG: RDD family protein [Bacteroidota bacterium]